VVRGLFKAAGSQVRYMRDIDKNEKASQFIFGAIEEALSRAELSKDEIDLMIYCGVGKGFLEPANAYFYAQKMGMGCSCFDIVDACMSWIRALEISYEFLKSGRYRHIMVVNGEFNSHHGYPDNFKVKDLRQVEYTFPTYTIGEAASATILSPSGQEWQFAFKSLPELADLCTIPLDGYDNFVEPSKRLGRNGLYNFVSYGREMFDAARRYLAPVVKQLVGDLNDPDIYFPHAASDAAYLAAAEDHSLPLDKMFAKVFPQYGNLVSASIPVAMHMAIDEGALKRGDKVVFCPASAGMVYGAVQFAF
jgi:3-oxoacyl-[acyl-carrier-protein] synthase III